MRTKVILYKLIEHAISKGLGAVTPILGQMSMKTYDIGNIIYKEAGTTVLARYFKRIPIALRVNHVAKYEGMNHPIELKEEWSYLQGDYYDYIFYKGTMIILRIHCMKDKENGWVNDYMISCLNNKHDIHNTKDLMRKIACEIRICDGDRSKTRYNVSRRHTMIECPDRPMRNWENTFVESRIRKELCESIHKFADSVEWYRKHQIPYHFGILLHGNPGTGKSSIVQAICNEIPSDIVVIQPGELWDALEEGIFANYRDLSRHLIVVIEDIDTNVLAKRRTRKDDEFMKRESDPELLGKLLNYIDGLGSPDGCIWIMTTNHLDKLDPALTRPGRIDLNFEIGYVSDETFAQFMKFHYNCSVPEEHQVRDGMIFADLQTKVMMGWTKEQMFQYTQDL
jgi:hypothetical protein